MKKLSASQKRTLQCHISPDPPIECIKEITRLYRNGDFGAEMLAHIFTVAAWLAAWADGDMLDVSVFGAGSDSADKRQELYSAVTELYQEISGERIKHEGPITDAIVAQVIQKLLAIIIKKATDGGFDWLVAIIQDMIQK